jgi:hypothetical protein
MKFIGQLVLQLKENHDCIAAVLIGILLLSDRLYIIKTVITGMVP